MKIYAIYKDGKLYKASYEQNTPFYETIKGAKAAIKSKTNRRCIPVNSKYKEKEIQDYLRKEKSRYVIVEFNLEKVKDILA